MTRIVERVLIEREPCQLSRDPWREVFARGRSLGNGTSLGQGRRCGREGAALDRERAEDEQCGCGIRRLLPLREWVGERERPLERRLRLGEAAQAEERAAQCPERASFTGDIPQTRFGAEKLVGEVLGLRELTTVECRIGEERERARQAGQVADRGRVLDASLGRAE